VTNYARDFAAIRAIAGNPTMTCVRPRTGWTSVVPAGYAYDLAYDRYVDGSDTAWDETSVTLPSDSVDIIPMDGQTLLDLIQGGMITVGDRVVHILAADYTTVNNAAWIVLDSLNYDKVEMTPFPASVPLWYIVNLRKR
jgi:hypothetical protein